MSSNTAAEKWVVDAGDERKRLDQFLVARFPQLSRSQIQRWIQDGRCTVNAKEVSKHHAVRAGDVVALGEKTKTEPVAEVAHRVDVEVPIMYEDDTLLVINKPAGLLVHPTSRSDEWTLVDFVRAHCDDLDGVGEDSMRPGIVHRLDRDVSGVMVIAKTHDAWMDLKRQFIERTTHKEYRAIVFGVPSTPVGTITFKIAHSKTHGGKMAARPEHEEGRDAWTEYTVLQEHKRFSELQLIIRTGRTHQIRAHLAAIDHPVVGDTVYGAKRTALTKGIERLYLHAHRLEFMHPATQKQCVFEAPIPKEFASFLSI